MIFVPWHPCTSAPVNAHGVASSTDDPSACKTPCYISQISISSKNSFDNAPYSQRAIHGAHLVLSLPARARARAPRYPSALLLAWPRALTRTIIVHSHAQHRAARARVAPAPQQPRRAIALGTPAPSNFAGRGAREPIQWPHAGDRYRATHRALPACLPPYTQTTS